MFTCPHGGKCAGKCVDCGLLVLRIILGLIFIIHGWGKVFGSGPAALGITQFSGFLGTLGVPAAGFFAWLIGLLELVGGLGLLLGIATRPLAVLFAIEMAFAFILASKFRLPKGDLELMLFGVSLALALTGAGAYALMPGKRETPSAPPPKGA